MAKWGAGISRRTTELPDNWVTELRPAVKARAGGRCEALMDSGQRCPEQGTDCHHMGDRMNHSAANLQWLCAWHHRAETGKQGATARNLLQGKLRHPGLSKPNTKANSANTNG